MHENKAKILSLVPSWTETLIEADQQVVGRTRFCIHPEDQVKTIPAVGGTKNMKLQEILNLAPDLVILDQEENKKEMAEALTAQEIATVASHVTDLQSAADFLEQLSQKLQSEKLHNFSVRYRSFSSGQVKLNPDRFWSQILLQGERPRQDNVEYVIWKNPYMVIGADTFIADVMARAGVNLLRQQKYPQISDDELKACFCLFSSEPFPFARDYEKLKSEGFRGALIDGEKISWYGIRNLKFLESCAE